VLSITYAASAMVHFSSATGGFDTLDNVLALFDHPGSTMAGWVHYLAFDLLVGWVLARHAITTSIKRFLIAPCLLLTFSFGPVGAIVYGCLLVAHRFSPNSSPVSQPGDKLIHQIFRGDVVLSRCAVVLLFFMPILLLAYSMETRTVLELNAWLKPIKFSIALVIYMLTLSWYSNYLSLPWRLSRSYKILVYSVVLAIILEILWLIFAAAIGEQSHFNQTHKLLMPIYFLMGLLATLLTSLSLVIGVGIMRNKESTLHSLTRYSLAYGLIATFILTLITAGYMSGNPAQSHAVLPDGVSSFSEREGLFILGWLRDVGDLRVSHFFATHALHVVPFVGFLLSTRSKSGLNNDETRHKKIAFILCALYCVFVIALFIQALLGKPFL